MAKRKKKAKPTAARYERHKEGAAERQAAISRAGRDIGKPPDPRDIGRRQQGRDSFEYFARTYFPETFNLPWSPDHRKIIDRIEESARSGGLFGYAMPRGSGKTSIAERAALWVVLYGYKSFPFLIGSDEGAALQLLQSMKSELENNQLLGEDFPEVCYPIQKLDGIAHRANGQLSDGQRTQIRWASDEIILPTIAGSVAAGAIVRVKGITGGFRGAKFQRPDGRPARPDFVIIDDPQTDESAKSPAQCQERIKLLTGAVLGLAGPGRKISGIMPCTVISPGDVADEILNRQKHPEWQGERTKLVYQFPTDEPKWEQYRKIRADGMRAGTGTREANEFYRANRETMDAGSEVAWPCRKNADDLSAIQYAMNLRFDLGEEAFFAEYQNDPIAARGEESEALTADQIAGKTNDRDRLEVPAECSKVVAFIDVQKEALYYTVAAFDDEFTGCVIDYGTFPDQRRTYFQLRDIKRTLSSVLKTGSMEEGIRRGLELLTADLLGKSWKRDDGAEMKIERCPIDANWGESTDVVYKFCRESVHAGVVIPSHGRFVGATSNAFGEYRRKRGDRIGHHWRITATAETKAQRRLTYDTNYYKTFLHQRLGVPKGGRGCLTLWGDSPSDHKLFADHLANSEDATKVEAKGRSVIEWKVKASRPDNHFLDCAVGCLVAASERGAALGEANAAQHQRQRRTVSIGKSGQRSHFTQGPRLN